MPLTSKRRLSFFASLILIVSATTQAEQVRLESSHPEHGASEVLVSSALQLRFGDALDVSTIQGITLHRKGKSNDSEVEVRRSTDLTNASITIVPQQFLDKEGDYVLRGAASLRAVDGTRVQPFEIEFRTGAGTSSAEAGLEFIAETFDSTRSMTTVLFGPDRKVYAASAFGEIVCWDTDETGRPGKRKTIYQDPKQSRQFIDLEWDPTADADNLLLWVSYAERLTPRTDERYYFTGEISRLRIQQDQIVEEIVFVTGLPHGREVQGGHETLPHQPNGLCFHDGMLYQSVGSTSSSGGPANWGVPEQVLSACLLEIDYQRIGDQPVDVFPKDNAFDPFAKDALVRHFATGIRNAVEVIAHSNGRLYTAVNINDRRKSSDGVPDDPDIPGNQNLLVENVTPDHESLYILERGRHYGFPNPSIGNYVLNGGNPTAEKDPFEITDYPVGTEPERGYAPELMYPIWQWGGTSPDGMIEYRPNSQHPLSNTILCCFYSANDIAVFWLGDDGMPTRIEKLRGPEGKLTFSGPLDITQDSDTGNLYVADFGKQSKFGSDGSLVWMRPVQQQN